MPGCVIKAILLSMVVASISFFASHSQLLAKFREWTYKATGRNFFYNLITCCYCLGHWIAAVVLIIFPMKLFGIFWPADYILTWLVISWMAGLQSLAASQLWGE